MTVQIVTTEAGSAEVPNPSFCYWCVRPFRLRRTGGRAQRFCRPNCRRQFHAAARRWALDAIGAGALTLADLKQGFHRACALSQAASGSDWLNGLTVG